MTSVEDPAQHSAARSLAGSLPLNATWLHGPGSSSFPLPSMPSNIIIFALGPWVDLLSVKYYFGGGLIGPWVDLLF